jgi:hypothetical protein
VPRLLHDSASYFPLYNNNYWKESEQMIKDDGISLVTHLIIVYRSLRHILIVYTFFVLILVSSKEELGIVHVCISYYEEMIDTLLF